MGPTGLAIDTKNRKLFSVCSNRMMVISDPDTGKVVTTVPIGAGPDAAAFDPGTGLIFSSNGGDGTMTIVQLNGGKYEVVENLPTQARSRTMTLDEKTHNLYFVRRRSRAGWRTRFGAGLIQGSGVQQIAHEKNFYFSAQYSCGGLMGRRPVGINGQRLPLAQSQGASAPPVVITLQDALERARKLDYEVQSAVADVKSAGEERVQAKASLLPGDQYHLAISRHPGKRRQPQRPIRFQRRGPHVSRLGSPS